MGSRAKEGCSGSRAVKIPMTTRLRLLGRHYPIKSQEVLVVGEG